MLIDGPRMPPTAGGKPSHLVIFLHGYGSNGADLMGLAPYLAKALPRAQFVAPNAPEPVAMAPGGYQWFPITHLDPRLMEQGVLRAAGGLDRFLDRELERYGLDESRLALVGFSQGTMMALHVGLRRARPLAGVVGFSGALVAPQRLKAEAKTAPPVLLVHGDRDDMVPVTAMFDAADALCDAGFSAQWHVSPGLPHSIGPDGIEIAGQFLRAALEGRFARAPALR
ncbi:MAG: dienelactone hydrolase family protein [Alphaproteobacteria bacterium]|nr:dienelactone hydrolase family protein [Alphaproteobacteria bacterium]